MEKYSNKINIIPVFVFSLAFSALLFIPFKVISLGFVPQDDAMRHAAKAVSGKSWNDILVLRDDIKMDSHPGWHAILTAIYKTTGCSTESLVVFSVIFLFMLFCLTPLFFMERPEAWLLALLAMAIANPGFTTRLFLGRPYIFTMFVIAVLGVLWPRLQLKRSCLPALCAFTLLIAASTWIHCLWYLFALPIICFFIARKYKEGIALTVCTVLGIALGASFTGHPFLMLAQTVTHGLRSLGDKTLTRLLVTEFQPADGDPIMVLLVLGMLLWRSGKASWKLRTINNPIFVLGVAGWILGFVVKRFWYDWGVPAITIWLAQEFQEAFKERIGVSSWRRLGITFIITLTLILSVTNDIYSRWTSNLSKAYLSSDNPDLKKGWLPDPGGIVYASEMTIFYEMFYKNPRAPWRYILGFEPTMMPADDLAILRKIQWNFGASEAFAPWIKKMHPEDRLIIKGSGVYPPNIAQLEWYYAATGIWLGRLPRKSK